jgi:probable addiction module antidote protein
MPKTTKFDVADYLDNPEIIQDYLNEALATKDEKYIAKAIGTVARAKGMTDIAAATGLGRESLYKSLGGETKPEFGTVQKVLDAMDFELEVKPKAAA